MADSTSNLDLLLQSQASKEITINAFSDAASQSALYGRRSSTTTGLTWGYFGGNLSILGVVTSISNGTISLTASSTNYVEVDPSTGTVSKNTTAFTSGYIKLYQITTGSSTVTSYLDKRSFLGNKFDQDLNKGSSVEFVNVNTTGAFKNGGVQVVGARGSSLPGDATDLATAITLVNAIKAGIKTTGGHGLFAD